MKNMVSLIPLSRCPNCGHGEFLVFEMNLNQYLTNRDGEVKDIIDEEHTIQGKCITCGKVYDMMVNINGFIPLTKLRKILYDDYYETTVVGAPIKNPMEKVK